MRLLVVLMLTLFAVSGCDDAEDPTPDMGPVETTFDVAFDATNEGAFLSVWGPTADEIWAVGGQPDSGVIWRFDGTDWAAETAPDGPLLNWVHGAGDVRWFVGNDGRALRRVGDGALEVVETGIDAPLWGVFAVSPDEAWAVGGEAVDDGNPADPVLARYQNGAWSRVELPSIDRDFRALFKVWGSGPNDVYAVGSKGVILHWDGAAWTQQGSGTGEDLISVFGVGDAVAIVGGRGNGLLVRKTADGWASETIVGNPGFNGIWMQADGTAWIAGNRGSLVSIAPGTFEATRHRSGTREVLHGIWGLANGHRIAVGGSLDSAPPYLGVAVETGR